MQVLPGMVSTTRTLTTDNARARSLIKLVTWLPLTPAAGSNSNRVITGPGCAVNTLTSIPKSISLRSIKREVKSSVSAEGNSTAPDGSSNKWIGGNAESGKDSNNGACFSFCTRALWVISNTGGSINTGGRSSTRLRSISTNSARSSPTALPAFLSCQSCHLYLINS